MYFCYFVIISPWKKVWPFQTGIPFTLECFVPSVVETRPVILGKIFGNFCYYRYYLTLENKLKSTSTKDALCQAWLKLALCFLRIFLNFVNKVNSFIIFPWKRASSFICINLNLINTRVRIAKFGLNWPSGSWE